MRNDNLLDKRNYNGKHNYLWQVFNVFVKTLLCCVGGQS